MKPIKFKTKLKKLGTWVIAVADIDVFKLFGTKKHLRTKGTISGYPYGSLCFMPFGDGTHYLAIKKEIRKAIRKDIGDTVEIIFEQDTAELEIPDELKEAFEASPEARLLFDSYSYSAKKYYTEYVSEAKRKDVKDKRAADAVIKLERLYQEKQWQTSKEKKQIK